MDVGEATGLDDISPRLLKQCIRELPGLLTSVLYLARARWKEARLVPIHKKNSKSEPSNYRPTSLLSVMGKVLKQIVTAAICQHVSENHLLSDRQFGFRPGRSTADLLGF